LAVAAHVPPPGWESVTVPQILAPLGIWMSPKTHESFVLYTSVAHIPRTTVAAMGTLRALQPVTNLKAVSARIGDLCGNTSIFFENRYVQDFYPVVADSAMTA